MKEMISIIVPVYNAEKTLQRCVASLVRQTYENIEIILVNDGSRDGSLMLCRELARQDDRIRVIDKPNGGVSSARNAGLDATQGDFIMFCDSDDWAESQWCEALHNEYQPEHMTVCDFFWDAVPPLEHDQPTETVEKRYYMHRSKLMCSPINKLFSASVIKNNPIRFSRKLSLGEDFVFCLTYLCSISADIRYVYRQLYHYDTANEDSLSKKAPALEQCELFYQEITSAMKTLGAMDETSIYTRDTLAAPHFERCLKAVAKDKSLSVFQKLSAAGQIGKTEGFRSTCRQGLKWGNPVYLWLMHHGYARLGMLYLLTVLKIKGRV